jgi:oxidase EvaA
VHKKELARLKGWVIDAHSGYIQHKSGAFFSVIGLQVNASLGLRDNWCQPIINQPEIGILGFIAQKKRGVLHFLVQAKIEPGNINVVQISPTLQATKSNYTQKHNGKKPRYLEYFNGDIDTKLISDQLQSEQGARFLKKRNRNVIIEVDESHVVPAHPDFSWMTIGQIKLLLKQPNLVNMDTRTVLSNAGLLWHENYPLNMLLNDYQDLNQSMLSSALDINAAYHSFEHILSWITELKCSNYLETEKIPLIDMSEWGYSNGCLIRHDKKYFSVIGVQVEIESREVQSWDQPMIEAAQEGLIAFIVRPINGALHFLVQAKVEAGNFDIVELAPTVQCLTGNYRLGMNEYSVPFIKEVLGVEKGQILHSSMQSEEGGRFFNEQNHSLIVQMDEDFPLEIPSNYCWMTLHQISRLIEFNNLVNIGARSLISTISFYKDL